MSAAKFPTTQEGRLRMTGRWLVKRCSETCEGTLLLLLAVAQQLLATVALPLRSALPFSVVQPPWIGRFRLRAISSAMNPPLPFFNSPEFLSPHLVATPTLRSLQRIERPPPRFSRSSSLRASIALAYANNSQHSVPDAPPFQPPLHPSLGASRHPPTLAAPSALRHDHLTV